MIKSTEIGTLLYHYDGYIKWLNNLNKRLDTEEEPIKCSLNGFMEYLRENAILSSRE